MTQQFSLQDSGNTYSWMWEGVSDDDVLAWTDADIENLLDTHVSMIRETYELDVREAAESKSYPCFGSTTADVLKNADEYVQYILADIEEEIADECESATAAVKAKQHEIRNEQALESVMTAAEAAEEFGLTESSVRKAIERDTIPARKSAGTWLILRSDAEKRWSDRRIEQEQYKKLQKAEQERYINEGLNEDDADLLPLDDGMAD